MSPTGLEPQNDCVNEGQHQLQTTDPSSRQNGCHLRTMIARVELKNLLVVILMGLGAETN